MVRAAKMVIKEFEIGSIPGLPEFRIATNDSDVVLFPAIQARSTTIHAFVVISQLEDAGEEFWHAIRECSMLAGTGAFIAGFLPGCVTALPVFMQMFGSCTASKGFNLISEQIQFRTQTNYSQWV